MGMGQGETRKEGEGQPAQFARVLEVSNEVKADHDWSVPTPTMVFVGSRMEMAHRQAFRAICQPKGIEVLDMHRADNSFKLFPVPFSR